MNNPSIYQINTRVVLQERGVALGRPATLDDLEDRFLDDIASKGFQWVWFLGVWQTGPAGRAISRSNPKLVEECRRVLVDLRDEDICGSPFAIVAYETHRDFGGDKALANLRERLAERNLKLLLDFVPNHTAPDHPWVQTHPEYYIHGSEEDLARQPQNYARVKPVAIGRKTMVLAYGRDPYFDGWPDTFQLNYRHAGFREARIAELGAIADRCDGVRCDMAMLLQPEIIQKTWGDRSRPADGSPPKDNPFWPEAIGAIKRRHGDFTFVAEVYWDMEWELQQAGFDYTYDKRLYDRLVAEAATPVREHLMADPAFQDHSMRFLENHDEPRAAATFPTPVHKAAAVVALLARGLRFIYEGQLEGRKVHVSMHVGRRPAEPVDEELRAFYLPLPRLSQAARGPRGAVAARELPPGLARKLHARAVHRVVVAGGRAAPAHGGELRRLTEGSATSPLGMEGLAGRSFELRDLLSDVVYKREGDGLAGNGLYLDLPPWGHHVFELRAGPA